MSSSHSSSNSNIYYRHPVPQQPPNHPRANILDHILSHPPSKLSPPPVAVLPDSITRQLPQTSEQVKRDTTSKDGEAGPSKKKENEGPKRGYRACVHCRLRKARCDLGDVNAPSSPPCTRCRREQRSCVFLPSKRRKKNQSDENDNIAEVYPAVPSAATSEASIQNEEWKPSILQLSTSTHPQNPPSASLNFSGLSATLSTPSWEESLIFPSNLAGPNVQHPPNSSLHSSSLDFHQTIHTDTPSIPNTTETPGSVPESNGSGSALSPTRSKRRRQHSPDATRRIIAANFSNETDALEILANAAAENESENAGHRSLAEDTSKGVRWDLGDHIKTAKSLEDYCLVKAGILGVADVESLVRLFFHNNHPVLPVFQTARIPKTPPQLALLASADPFLLSTMILVASRHHAEPRMRTVHERTWDFVRDALADYSFSGLSASVGFVEGVLLLAEFLPREKSSRPMSTQLLGVRRGGGGGGGSTLEGTENRRSWALTGLAIRAAYGIGLDQIAIEVGGERTAEMERARSAWTWCYLYDRTIGLRTGLAFWSRGPNLCFTGYSHISQTGEAAARENFPYMLSPGGPGDQGAGDDSASLMQALMELTQIMTNAHDILYPSKGRTSALVLQGTYFKYCDHFRKALDSYAQVWTDKKWRNPSLKELAFCTYHFVRLYVSSFAFQAHVQRAQMRAEEEAGWEGRNGSGTQLFPRGSATSPDAPYIYDSIDAANEILNICLRLGQMGVLQNLPSRYLINFVYGGVFALKAGYSGATSKRDMIKTKEIVDTVCAALVLSCSDRDHPASRYGGMLRMLAKKLEELSDASAVPSRFPSPEPAMPTTGETLNPFLREATPKQGRDLQMTEFSLPSTDTADGLFDFDLEGVNFNLDGFWEDFSLLGESSGFPFK